MGSRMGFEYRYHFWVDDEIISRYGSYYEKEDMRFVFETRTNFIVKGKFDDGDEFKIMDSERYDIGASDKCFHEEYLKFWMGRRLKDYWMCDDEIQELVHQALTFAKHPQHASRPMISIAVGLDVCTVQQEGEPINATMDRAMRAEYLYPIYLCPLNETSRPKERKDRPEGYEVDFNLLGFLREELHTIRVEDVDKGLSLMEMCGICLRNPTIGTQISLLQCGHAFHNHCIVRWLEDDNSCPICHHQAHDDFQNSEEFLYLD